jgi:putative spermidine/putrescine transport system substrate-binding protein
MTEASKETMTARLLTSRLSRRGVLQGTAAGVALLGAPSVLRAQTREIVVGGAASHKKWVDEIAIPSFEKKYSCKVLFEGTRSLVNLEKMQSNKAKPIISVVQMDDPVMILAVQEDLLDKLTVAELPNLAKIKPSAIHMEGMWANYLQPWQGIAYNKAAKPKGIASWQEMWDPANKGRVVLPSLQNTEGLANLFIAAHLATGKPYAQSQFETDAGFEMLKKLKPNLLTIYTQMPQAFNLLEQGEATMIGGALSSFALQRAADGAPIDLAAPKEGIFASPSGIARVKGGPNPDLAAAYINELLGAEIQAQLVGPVFSLPTNTAVANPPGIPANVEVVPTDWAFVAKNRKSWIERWDRDMSI